MKESHKRTLGNLQAGFIKLLKIIWIILRSFGEALTWDFYENIKKYWKKTFKKVAQEPIKKTPAPIKPKAPLP